MHTGTDKKILIATDWEYDQYFIELLKTFFHDCHFNVTVVDKDNLLPVIQDVESGNLKIQAMIDRASDTSPEFTRLQSLLSNSGVLIIDPVEQIRWVSDKATLHLEFLSAGIPTPYTLILPPYAEKNSPALHVDDLAILGRPFVIKPANTTGGGVGVVDGAESLQEVLHARKEFQSDKYLIQEKIIPMERDGYRFWFRSFYAGGQIFTTWWHDVTHQYSAIHDDVIEPFGLMQIPKLMRRIAKISMLTFFSSEIVYSRNGQWVVVDYVNESCDMRPQSNTWDGVPNRLIKQMAETLVVHTVRLSSSR